MWCRNEFAFALPSRSVCLGNLPVRNSQRALCFCWVTIVTVVHVNVVSIVIMKVDVANCCKCEPPGVSLKCELYGVSFMQ